MWPDFDIADFDTALDEFNRRERRFGEVPATLEADLQNLAFVADEPSGSAFARATAQ